MIKKIGRFIGIKSKKSRTDFFSLSSSEQKKIINKAVRDANIEQSNLVKNYNRKFGKINTNGYKV